MWRVLVTATEPSSLTWRAAEVVVVWVILTSALAVTMTVRSSEAKLLLGSGSTTWRVEGKTLLLKVKVCSLFSVQWMVKTSVTATGVETGRLMIESFATKTVQPTGALAGAVMSTLTGPTGPLLWSGLVTVTPTDVRGGSDADADFERAYA